MKLSKVVKRFFTFLIAFIALILIAAFAIPYFFKDEIMAKVKEETNKSINAKFDFSDASLSLIRSFPDFSLSLQDLSIVGVEEFENVPLVKAKNINLSLDLMSVIQSESPIEIHTVSMDQPEVNVLVLKNGKANYDIAKPSDAPAESTSEESYDFLIQLKNYEISEGKFTYDDRAGDIFLNIENLNHSGKGDFTQDVFDLVTTTSIDRLTAKSGGINYLKNAQTNLDATFNIDMPNSTYTLKDNDLKINAMQLLADGFVKMPGGEDIVIDFTFDAPQNDFKHLLSLIPSAYTSDFSDVKASGKMAFNGYVKGTYNATKEQLPAFKIKLDIDNGNFQYPDLPMGINNIFTNVNVESPSSNFDQMKVDVASFKLNLDGEPFEGYFKLRTPISDPDIDTKVKGKIDLADINKAFPVEGVTELSGILNADASIKTRLSTIEKEDYENVKMEGEASLQQFIYKADGLPKVAIDDTQVDFTPKRIIVNNFKGKLGKSDVEATGNIDNLLAYFSPEKTMTGDFKVRSKYFDLNEWMEEETPSTSASSTTTSATAETEEPYEIFDQFDFNFDAIAGKVVYDVYELDNSIATGSFSPKRLKINDFRTNIGKSDLSGSGSLTNIFDYVFNDGILGGDMNLTSSFFDLNPFMEETEEPQAQKIAYNETESYEPIIVPDNVDVNIDANIGKVLYGDMALKEFKGNLKVKNSEVAMKDISAKMLGGRMVADGSYNTKNPEKPTYTFSYDISKFDFRNTFENMNTFQKLAPIAKFISGNFSSKLTINGELGKDLMPVLETLNADGFLETVNGFISDYKPLKEVGNKLGINELSNHKINLDKTKNWFTIKDGFIEMKEFPLKYQDIEMKIGGKHNLTNVMDYNIIAKIPVERISKNKVGGAAVSGLEFLNKEASKLGLKLDAGKFVNVLINLKGSMAKPDVSFKLLGSEGNASLKDVVTNTLEVAKDSVTKVVETKVEEVKEDFSEKMNAEIKSITEDSEKQISKLMKEAEAKSEQIRKEGKRLAEQGRTEGYKQADDLIKKAGNNIFKKKAAEVAAKELRKKTDKTADDAIGVANKKADDVMVAAKKQADGIRKRRDDQIAAVKKKYDK